MSCNYFLLFNNNIKYTDNIVVFTQHEKVKTLYFQWIRPDYSHLLF